MSKDFLPARDGALLTWAINFSAKTTAAPTDYGLTAEQAADFAGLLATFRLALMASDDPATRTRGTIAAKDAARAPLRQMARELARIINAFPATTNQQRLDLALNPRTGQGSPIQPPDECPVLEVVAALGRLLKLRLHAIDSARRGKPDGVQGASIFSFVGDTPPADLNLWTFEGSTTRTTADVEFPPAGAQVFLCAYWFNPRSQAGPACQPVSAYLAGGVVGTQQEAA